MSSRNQHPAAAHGRAKAVARGSGRVKVPDAPPRLDATNLAGLTSLMNPQNLRPNVDLEAAERTVMGRVGAASPEKKRTSEVDPIKLYTKEMHEIASELGIDLLDEDGLGDDASVGASDGVPDPRAVYYGGGPPARGAGALKASRPRDPLGGRAIDEFIGDLDLGSDSAGKQDSDAGSDGMEDSNLDSKDEDSADKDGSDDFDDSGSADVDEEGSDDDAQSKADDDSVLSNLGKNLGISLDGARRRGKRRRRIHDIPMATGAHGRPRPGSLTEEQERRQHINSVMGAMRQETRTSSGVEHERAQDVKASKLEQIGQLRMTLEEEGVDCGGVGAPSMTSPTDEIDSVLAILKLKNDRNRYSSLAEEVILGIAEMIETVFNGTREVPFVGWKPDYTGYHNTVNVKLHRMRFETSQVVGNAIEKYNVGPLNRIIMELIPSFFLYPRQQHKQRGSPGLHADFAGGGHQVSRVGDARRAYSAIRRANDPDTINSVTSI